MSYTVTIRNLRQQCQLSMPARLNDERTVKVGEMDLPITMLDGATFVRGNRGIEDVAACQLPGNANG